MNALSKDILQEASEVFKRARGTVMEGARLLYEIQKKGLWVGNYESFGEFVQMECEIKASFASKLIAVWERYAIQGGIDPIKLAGVDSERLYLAAKLPGDPEKQYITATTLSRSELRQETRDPNEECAHEKTITICGDCGKRL